jgi:hypothetical protein
MSHFVRTFKRRKVFLDQLAVGASISFAAEAAGGTVGNFRAWKKSDPDFAADWEEAVDSGTDFIEDVALERALTKSDPLMQMILKARRPDKYDRGGKLELSGGISVEGAKSKLLNRIAKLQAAGAGYLLESGSEEEPEASGSMEEEGASGRALPAPSPDQELEPAGSNPPMVRRRRRS